MWYKSITIKLISIVGLAVALGVGIFARINVDIQEQGLTAEVIRGVSQFSETVKRSTWHDMLKDMRENVYRTMNSIAQQEGVEKVRIFNKEGKIMFSTDISERGTTVDLKAEACYACHAMKQPLERLDTPERQRIFRSKAGYRVLGMISPIYNEEACYTANCHAHPRSQTILGVLDIDMSLAKIDSTIGAARYRMMMFAAVSILSISLIIGFFIHRVITRPVQQLVEGMREVARGDLERSISIDSNDEMGYLAGSFNKMTQDLKKANEDIQEWVKTLESKVKEKTEELMQVQNQLIQSEKLVSLGKLAAGVAHEINSPLTGILTFSNMLLKKIENDDPRKEDLEIVVQESLRCRRIVQGLLDFARQRKPEKKNHNINRIIEETLSLIEKPMILQNISINRDLNAQLTEISVDVDQIQQVFLNIIMNAQEAMGQKGTLTISTRALRDFVEIRFSDTGCGIAEQNINRVFDPFFTTKGNTKGTGLGLSVSYGIIERHQGTIRIKSKLGEGTTVIVNLPISD